MRGNSYVFGVFVALLSTALNLPGAGVARAEPEQTRGDSRVEDYLLGFYDPSRHDREDSPLRQPFGGMRKIAPAFDAVAPSDPIASPLQFSDRGERASGGERQNTLIVPGPQSGVHDNLTSDVLARGAIEAMKGPLAVKMATVSLAEPMVATNNFHAQMLANSWYAHGLQADLVMMNQASHMPEAGPAAMNMYYNCVAYFTRVKGLPVADAQMQCLGDRGADKLNQGDPGFVTADDMNADVATPGRVTLVDYLFEQEKVSMRDYQRNADFAAHLAEMKEMFRKYIGDLEITLDDLGGGGHLPSRARNFYVKKIPPTSDIDLADTYLKTAHTNLVEMVGSYCTFVNGGGTTATTAPSEFPFAAGAVPPSFWEADSGHILDSQLAAVSFQGAPFKPILIDALYRAVASRMLGGIDCDQFDSEEASTGPLMAVFDPARRESATREAQYFFALAQRIGRGKLLERALSLEKYVTSLTSGKTNPWVKTQAVEMIHEFAQSENLREDLAQTVASLEDTVTRLAREAGELANRGGKLLAVSGEAAPKSEPTS